MWNDYCNYAHIRHFMGLNDFKAQDQDKRAQTNIQEVCKIEY